MTPRSSASSVPLMSRLTEIVERMTMIKMPSTSSMTSDPITSDAYFSFWTPSSSKHFWITTVELIDSIAPRKIQLNWLSPIILPNAYPTSIMPPILTAAETIAVPPISAILWRSNSSPIWNSIITTPISLHVSIDAWLVTSKNKGKYGLIRKPATI